MIAEAQPTEEDEPLAIEREDIEQYAQKPRQSVQPRTSVLSYEDHMDQIFSDAELSDDVGATPMRKMEDYRTVTPSLKLDAEKAHRAAKQVRKKGRTRTVTGLADLITTDVI